MRVYTYNIGESVVVAHMHKCVYDRIVYTRDIVQAGALETLSLGNNATLWFLAVDWPCISMGTAIRYRINW